jgi:hypothetical protein
MIREYAPFFIKKWFDIPNYKKKKTKKKIVLNDYLFYSFFYKMNNLDITCIDKFNEKQEKILLAEKIDKLKFKNKDFIMNNLIYDATIHLMTLHILCIHYNVSLIFIKQNAYYKMNVTDHLKENVMCMNDKYHFIDFNIHQLDDYYEITHLDKPLFSLSYYKVTDLIEISKKLKLPHDGKKQILYDNIYSHLVKLNIYKID